MKSTEEQSPTPASPAPSSLPLPSCRNRRGGLCLLTWAGLTVAALCVDQPLDHWFDSGFEKHFIRPILLFPNYMGGYAIHILVAALLFGFLSRRRLILEYALPMSGSIFICTLLKYVVGRARPQLDLGPLHFEPFSAPAMAMNSFPSGDATAAMALATILGLYFPRSRWLFWAIGAWAALGRVTMDYHFLSDVVFGAGLGIACVLVWAECLGPGHHRFR